MIPSKTPPFRRYKGYGDSQLLFDLFMPFEIKVSKSFLEYASSFYFNLFPFF
jgi:hypothetical protein